MGLAGCPDPEGSLQSRAHLATVLVDASLHGDISGDVPFEMVIPTFLGVLALTKHLRLLSFVNLRLKTDGFYHHA